MSLRQLLVSRPVPVLLKSACCYLGQPITARLPYTTALPTQHDTTVILKLSEGLPSILDPALRDKICTRFWMTLSKAERKEISDAFKISSQPVQKSASGSPIDFVSNAAPEFECWVDASTVPACIAVLVNNSFITFKLKDGWNNGTGMDIHWAETVGLELTARVLVALGHSGIRARVRSDSLWAINAFSGVKCKAEGINESMDRSRALLAKSNIKMNCVQVASKQNIADAFTRGKYDPAYNRLDCDVPLPKELVPLLHVFEVDLLCSEYSFRAD